jgi:hypothetical protein
MSLLCPKIVNLGQHHKIQKTPIFKSLTFKKNDEHLFFKRCNIFLFLVEWLLWFKQPPKIHLCGPILHVFIYLHTLLFVNLGYLILIVGRSIIM